MISIASWDSNICYPKEGKKAISEKEEGREGEREGGREGILINDVACEREKREEIGRIGGRISGGEAY